jgi:hypothetical protein
MPDVNENPTEILVYSWRPLWIYWPVYLALALTEKKLNLTFRLKHPEDPITDEAIRAALGAALKNRGETAIALCEPGPVSDLPLSRIPIIWRMPHWLITAHPVARLGTLWCYPEKTTSGDYARKLIGAGLIHAEETSAFQYQNSLLLDDGDTKAAGTLTFTPIHLWNPGLHFRLFPGPERDITALIIPRAGLPPECENLADAIRTNFQRVLQGLGTTHGDVQLVRTFIRDYQPQVEKFYASTEYPSPPDHLSMALAEYICHGCYFPYSVVRSALDGELRSIANEALSLARETAQQRISENVTKLLGAGRDWSALSFPEREFVWTSGKDRHGNGLNVRVTHEQNLQPILSGTPVSLSPCDLKISVSSLNLKARPLLCVAEGNKRCLNWIPSNKLKPDGDDDDPCFRCTIGGVVMPILRSAAKKIETALGGSVHYGTCITGKDPQSILCWDDIADLVDLYCQEGKSKASGHEHYVTLCPVGESAVSFSILWTGLPETSGRPGNATRTITYWASSHTDASRKVLAAGFWRKPNYSRIYPDEALAYSVCSCHTEYNFGYVVFFPAGGAS